MSPKNAGQFDENLKEIREKGPLGPKEMEFMMKFGDVVHHTKKWFMG